MRGAIKWIVLAAIVALIGWKLYTSHFDWAGFVGSLRQANPLLVAAAVVVSWGTNLVRALRWSVFLRPAFKQTGLRPVPWYDLIGSQFIGFTGLAVFGRIGELIRPLLVSRRTGLTFSSQIAVVAVERVFDLGAFAAIFSLNLLLAPGLRTLPYHELFHKVGFAIAGLTLVLGAFVLGVRLAGGAVAAGVRRLVGLISKPAGVSAEEKVLAFRDGLNVIASVPDFLLVALLSMLLWGLIAVLYVLTMHAFAEPVHSLTIADALVVMGFSVVGNVVQLPGIGGGAQLMTIGALTKLFSIPGELAGAAGLLIWLIGSIAVVPVGLIYARVEGISLRQVAKGSEAA